MAIGHIKSLGDKTALKRTWRNVGASLLTIGVALGCYERPEENKNSVESTTNSAPQTVHDPSTAENARGQLPVLTNQPFYPTPGLRTARPAEATLKDLLSIWNSPNATPEER